MGAAAEQHGAFSIGMSEAGLMRAFLRFRSLVTSIWIVFDTSNGANPVARNPDRHPSIDIIQLLCADQIQCRNVGATKNRNRRNLLSDLGDKRAFTNIVGIRRSCASATRFGQTSASTSTIRVGLITENARRMIGQ